MGMMHGLLVDEIELVVLLERKRMSRRSFAVETGEFVVVVAAIAHFVVLYVEVLMLSKMQIEWCAKVRVQL
jgi:hypothetical protein